MPADGTFAIVQDAQGKFSYVFDGQVLGCDAGRCPLDTMQCTKNNPWLALPAMCTCVIYRAAIGPDCGSLSPSGQAYLATSVLSATLAFLALFRALHAVYTFRVLRRRNSLAQTCVWTALGSCFLGVTMLCFVHDCLSPSMVTDDNGEQYSPLYVAEGPLLGLAFFFVAAASLSISVNWVEAALSFGSPPINRARIARYKHALYGCYVLFAALIIVVAFLPGGLANSVDATIAPLALCLVIYCVAWRRIFALSLAIKARQGMLPGADKLLLILGNIFWTTMYLIVTISGLLLSSLAFIAVGGFSQVTPESQPASVAIACLYLFACLVPHALINYIVKDVSRSVKARRQLSSVLESGVDDGSQRPRSDAPAARGPSSLELSSSQSRSTPSSAPPLRPVAAKPKSSKPFKLRRNRRLETVPDLSLDKWSMISDDVDTDRSALPPQLSQPQPPQPQPPQPQPPQPLPRGSVMD